MHSGAAYDGCETIIISHNLIGQILVVLNSWQSKGTVIETTKTPLHKPIYGNDYFQNMYRDLARIPVQSEYQVTVLNLATRATPNIEKAGNQAEQHRQWVGKDVDEEGQNMGLQSQHFIYGPKLDSIELVSLA